MALITRTMTLGLKKCVWLYVLMVRGLHIFGGGQMHVLNKISFNENSNGKEIETWI
jgi:hypothetical protein